MKDYISRQAAVEVANKHEVASRKDFPLEDYEFGINETASAIAGELEELPSADVVEVVHGRWIDPPDDDWDGDWDVYECSCCGASLATYASKMNGYYLYCPKCGAKMDGAEEES